MKVSGQAQAELIKIAAIGAGVLIVSYYLKKGVTDLAGAASNSVNDAVDSVIAASNDAWRAFSEKALDVAQTPIAEFAQPKAPAVVPSPRIDLPTSPAGIVFFIDTALSRFTAYLRGVL